MHGEEMNVEVDKVETPEKTKAVEGELPFGGDGKFAMFVEDVEIVFHVFEEGVTHEVLAKQFWLLDGRFTGEELVEWSQDIINSRLTTMAEVDSRLNDIDANCATAKIFGCDWENMNLHVKECIKELSREEYVAWMLGLDSICDGRPRLGEMFLRNAGVIK